MHRLSWNARSFMRLKKLINSLLTKPDYPSLLEETAEPRPYMNNYVAAFTVSKKSINLLYINFIYKKIVVCKV